MFIIYLSIVSYTVAYLSSYLFILRTVFLYYDLIKIRFPLCSYAFTEHLVNVHADQKSYSLTLLPRQKLIKLIDFFTIGKSNTWLKMVLCPPSPQI